MWTNESCNVELVRLDKCMNQVLCRHMGKDFQRFDYDPIGHKYRYQYQKATSNFRVKVLTTIQRT